MVKKGKRNKSTKKERSREYNVSRDKDKKEETWRFSLSDWRSSIPVRKAEF
jgi:hypothetical protein